MVNISDILQGAVFSPYLFLAYINDLCASSLVNYSNIRMTLFSVSLYQAVDFLDFPNNVHDFFLRFSWNLNLSKCVQCLFTISRSSYPIDASVINAEPPTGVDSLNHLGFAVDKILKRHHPISGCAEHLRILPFYIKRQTFPGLAKHHFPVCLPMCFSRPHLTLACHFWHFTKETLQNPSSWFVNYQ